MSRLSSQVMWRAILISFENITKTTDVNTTKWMKIINDLQEMHLQSAFQVNTDI